MQLPRKLTLDEIAAALAVLKLDGDAGGAFEVDASVLDEFDSAALALLLHAKRSAQAAGRSFAVHGAPPKLQQLAQLYGVADLLGLEVGGAGGG
jgi:phospholipid transport system transporter-binding protein